MQPAERRRCLETLAARIRACVECPLHASRTVAVPGTGPVGAPVMIIGEAPGKDEDRTGLPFVGSAGRYLDHVLEGTGLQRSDFFLTNIVKCRPPGNRTPRAGEVLTCTGLYLWKQIEWVRPSFLLLLGGVAVRTVLDMASVEAARNRVWQLDGRKIIATYHPPVRFYREDLALKIKEDFQKLLDCLRGTGFRREAASLRR